MTGQSLTRLIGGGCNKVKFSKLCFAGIFEFTTEYDVYIVNTCAIIVLFLIPLVSRLFFVYACW